MTNSRVAVHSPATGLSGPPRPKRLKKILRATAVLLSAVLLTALLFGVWFIRRPWPQKSGTLIAAGLQQPVEILSDRWGTPHIYARTPHDLFFAQGYAQAQDRLWQMEFTRRVGNGSLSSILGPNALGIDRLVRTLGLRRTAERDWAGIRGEEHDVIQAYSDGVNAYIDSHRDRLSVEFRLLHVVPGRWTPQDILVTVGLMSWVLSENASFELSRAHFIARAGDAVTKQLLPPYNEGQPFIIPAEARDYSALRNVPMDRSQMVEALLGSPGPNVGSNGWVVAGGRTATGSPLLANDTHLDLFMPSTWYATGLHGGGFDVVGYSFVGTPGIVLGHNQHIAWGITDLAGDVEDFYMEKVDNPAQPRRYEFRGQWRDLDVSAETIEVKGQKPVTLEVLRTHHGPLVSALGGRFAYPQPLALAWSGDKCETAIGALILVNRAQGWDDFRKALRLWDGPDMNFIYADQVGNIGYQAAARIPVRSARHTGSVPVPGWTGEYEWQGYVPPAELPAQFNPSEKFIVTANQKAVSDKYPYRLGYEYADPFRAIRIAQLLSAGRGMTVDDMKRIQGDDYHLPAKELIPFLSVVKPKSDLEERALERIRSWNLHCSVDETGPAIFQVWYRFLVEDTVGDELGHELTVEYMEYYWVHMPMMIDLMKQRDNPLFDDIRTPQVETRDDIVQRSFDHAVEWLSGHYGSKVENWTWGKMHPVTFRHRPLGIAQIPVVSKLFNYGPVPDAGCDRFTVNASWFITGDQPDHPFDAAAGVSQRIIIDLSSWENTMAANSTGQSEHLFHPLRQDEIAMWKKTELHPLRFTRRAVEADGPSILKLLPAAHQETGTPASNTAANYK